MPSNAPLGTASLRVMVGSTMSNPMTVRIAASAFGIFTATGSGLGPGVLFNYVSAKAQPINSATVPAQPGQLITLYGTGLGPVAGGDNVAPPSGNLPTPVQVFVGGESAPVMYSGRTPCCAGLDQIVFKLPADVVLGCWVPVYVQTAGTGVSNVVTMAISANGSACSPPQNPLSQALVAGLKVGAFIAIRGVTHEDVGTVAPVDVTGDYTAAFAYNVSASPFPFDPTASLPPPGTCTVYSVAGDLLGGGALAGTVPNGMPLDWGATFSLTGPHGTQTMSSLFSTGWVSYLGGALSSNLIPSSLFLDPGAYTLMGIGGSDVGPFTVSFTVPQPLTWTNQSQLTNLSRSQPLTVSWSGGAAGQLVGVVGIGEDLPTNASTVFACLAPPNATSFTVPAAILTNLPATRPNVLQSKSVIYLVSLTPSSGAPLKASGLDVGAAAFSYISGKTVIWQ
jgi:uncharacterized protein (TIGR03437 family)